MIVILRLILERKKKKTQSFTYLQSSLIQALRRYFIVFLLHVSDFIYSYRLLRHTYIPEIFRKS